MVAIDWNLALFGQIQEIKHAENKEKSIMFLDFFFKQTSRRAFERRLIRLTLFQLFE